MVFKKTFVLRFCKTKNKTNSITHSYLQTELLVCRSGVELQGIYNFNLINEINGHKLFDLKFLNGDYLINFSPTLGAKAYSGLRKNAL